VIVLVNTVFQIRTHVTSLVDVEQANPLGNSLTSSPHLGHLPITSPDERLANFSVIVFSFNSLIVSSTKSRISFSKSSRLKSLFSILFNFASHIGVISGVFRL
jgi:hypothetical protein